MKTNEVTYLIDEAAAPGSGEKYQMRGAKHTFHANGKTTAGAGAAAIKIFASNKKEADKAVATDWLELDEITLVLGTTRTHDSFTIDAPYKWVRAEVMSISGTGATVSAWLGS